MEIESSQVAQIKRSGKFSFTISYPFILDGRRVDEHKEYRTASGKFNDEDYEKFKKENPAVPPSYRLITE